MPELKVSATMPSKYMIFQLKKKAPVNPPFHSSIAGDKPRIDDTHLVDFLDSNSYSDSVRETHKAEIDIRATEVVNRLGMCGAFPEFSLQHPCRKSHDRVQLQLQGSNDLSWPPGLRGCLHACAKK